MKYWITDNEGNAYYIWELGEDVSRIGEIKSKIANKIIRKKEQLLEKLVKYFVRNKTEAVIA